MEHPECKVCQLLAQAGVDEKIINEYHNSEIGFENLPGAARSALEESRVLEPYTVTMTFAGEGVVEEWYYHSLDAVRKDLSKSLTDAEIEELLRDGSLVLGTYESLNFYGPDD